ncbi:endopeptidase LytE [Thermotomaculum hydrothermale]|uniref:Endopeptidase LytE n=1 Tax=Thermotomaculum hydrothermale TaxID=981385 RepID=A0A7R6PH37_9BACT|nr:endopeptidase LytE [Thermotomaculum hydrothermale]
MKRFLISFGIFVFLFSVSCHKKPTYEPANVVVAIAYKQIGKPYALGGKGPYSFDCSGLVYYCYKHAGYNLPSTTKKLKKVGKKVTGKLKFKKLKKGDILFFKIGKIFGGPNHVGIYVGNREMIHASPTKGVVKVYLKTNYWEKHFKYARRVIY